MEKTVLKRDGGTENFSIEKINRVLQWATDGLKDVSISDIEINAKLNIRDGITTKEIHQVLIESAANLISVENSDYQYVASRLRLYSLRKDVWGGKNPPRLYDVIAKGVTENFYHPSLLEKYSEAEINKFGEFINHDKDFIFTYCGIKQLCDKYLIKNRVTKVIFETPQFAYMIQAMKGFENIANKKQRSDLVKRHYLDSSSHKNNLPTPVMAGVRGLVESYASCCLIDVADTRGSITASSTSIALATASRYGIGLNVGRIRAIGSEVRNGETIHPGLIPFLKIFESNVKAWAQGGLRGGSATVNIPWWHYEIQDVVVLKNNGGTDDNRVRKLDYCIGLSKLFLDRFLKEEDITLFNPIEVPDLYEKFGHEGFDELYVKLEKDKKIKFKKKVSAQSVFSLIVKERVETGRIYIAFIDSINTHSSWDLDVKMANLCLEISTPTVPLEDFNDPNGEIGICTLGGLNLLNIKNDSELERTCDTLVRFLDELLDNQKYFNKAAENFATKRRSLGIGITNLAAFLAKNKLKYSSPETPNFIDETMEKIQFFLLKSSNQLAKEKGKCEKYHETKYSKGIFPIDTYKKNLDKVVTRSLSMDWEWLRKEVAEHGLRHSTLSAMMPVESSSLIQNATNGCEPVRSLMTHKGSKVNRLPFIAPGADKYGRYYEFAFDIPDVRSIVNVNAAIQKYCDMNMSTNFYYRYSNYENGLLPDQLVMKDIIYAYSMGLHTLYYNNVDDGDKEQALEEKGSCSIGGGCTL